MNLSTIPDDWLFSGLVENELSNLIENHDFQGKLRFYTPDADTTCRLPPGTRKPETWEPVQTLANTIFVAALARELKRIVKSGAQTKKGVRTVKKNRISSKSSFPLPRYYSRACLRQNGSTSHVERRTNGRQHELTTITPKCARSRVRIDDFQVFGEFRKLSTFHRGAESDPAPATEKLRTSRFA